MFLVTMILEAALGAILGKIGAALCATIAAFAGGYAISKIAKTTMESIARQPESASSMRSSLIIAAGMIEGATLFAIIVCFLTLVL